MLNPVNAQPGGVDVLGAEVTLVAAAPGAQGPRAPRAHLGARWRGWAPPPLTRATAHPRAATSPPDLTRAIERAGYYPALVADVVPSALAGEEVVSHLVHQETTFDHDVVRRHITVLALTTSRLVIAHADDHADDHEEPTADEAVATATTESVPLQRRARGHAHPRRGPTRRRTSPGRSAAS